MSITKKALSLVAILPFLPGFGSFERLFAPDAELWQRWIAHDATSQARIDHTTWDRLLSAHVVRDTSGINLVDYAGFSDDDRTALGQYVRSLSDMPISGFNRDEQLAFWINLYNALTIDLVLAHYPVDSIRDISSGFLSFGPWDKQLVAVEGEELSLNDIEHRIIRPIWKDPRIHYAVNCAAIGCPNLRREAYGGAGIDRALTEAAIEYVNDPRGVTISGDEIIVSSIYDWFIEDFGGSEHGVLRHLQQYAAPDLATRLGEIGELDGTQYDWSLNAAR